MISFNYHSLFRRTDSIQKLLSNPLVTFLLGLSISGLVIIIVVPIFRQKLFEVLKGGWERILPDIVEGLYSLWKMILKLILNK
jgi:hypothetical protein